MQRADKRKYHYIYKITRFDGKYYIGMHSTDNLEDGYFGSGKLITRSIKKYGIEKHSKEILEFVFDRVSLKEREKELITEEIINDPLCMNLQLGGGGGFINEEHQLKALSAGSALGGKAAQLKLTREERQRRSRKAAATAIHRGNYWHCDWSGRQHSDAAKTRMSATRKARGSGVGEKNSQFGVKRIGINKDGIVKKIIPDVLQSYLEDGWSKGFKPKIK